VLALSSYDLNTILISWSTGVFNKELLRGLHCNITLNQIPFDAFITRMARPDLCMGPAYDFGNELLASALFNATQVPIRKCHYPMAHRIRNCTLVARCIDANHDPTHRRELVEMLCTTASTSRRCFSYIYTMLRSGLGAHVGFDDDVLLEAALLVACGYEIDDVKTWMVKLGRKGFLRGYRGKKSDDRWQSCF
jgi:hypothetical protein